MREAFLPLPLVSPLFLREIPLSASDPQHLLHPDVGQTHDFFIRIGTRKQRNLR